MSRLIKLDKREDILPKYRDTPIGLLIEYHNFNREYKEYTSAQLLVGMCMDNRKHLHIPENFTYIIRSGGANLRNSEFRVSYAIAVGGIRHIALIAHNNCGMVNLKARKELFIEGLIERAGWDREMAEDHFNQNEPSHEIGHEIDFIISESCRLRQRYPKIVVAPMYYSVDDNRLFLVNEDE